MAPFSTVLCMITRESGDVSHSPPPAEHLVPGGSVGVRVGREAVTTGSAGKRPGALTGHACQVGGLPCPRGTPVSHTCGALTPDEWALGAARPIRSGAQLCPMQGTRRSPSRARQLLRTGPLTHLHLGARAAATLRQSGSWGSDGAGWGQGLRLLLLGAHSPLWHTGLGAGPAGLPSALAASPRPAGQLSGCSHGRSLQQPCKGAGRLGVEVWARVTPSAGLP